MKNLKKLIGTTLIIVSAISPVLSERYCYILEQGEKYKQIERDHTDLLIKNKVLCTRDQEKILNIIKTTQEKRTLIEQKKEKFKIYSPWLRPLYKQLDSRYNLQE